MHERIEGKPENGFRNKVNLILSLENL